MGELIIDAGKITCYDKKQEENHKTEEGGVLFSSRSNWVTK